MDREKRKQLYAAGWRPIPDAAFWLNSKGEQIDTQTGKTKIPRSVQTPHGNISTEKAVLWLFGGITPRKGQVTHIDGNKANKALENLKYSSLALAATPETVNRADLLRAIRCYCQIGRMDKPIVSDFMTRLYLQIVAKARNYAAAHSKEPHFALFANWIDNRATIPDAAKAHGVGIRDARTIIARYVNTLTGEAVADLQAGRLELQPYLPTARELRQRETALLHAHGVKRTAPPRFPKEIKAGFDRLGIALPAHPDWERLAFCPRGAKLVTWLVRADELITKHIATESDPSKQAELSALQTRLRETIGRTDFWRQ